MASATATAWDIGRSRGAHKGYSKKSGTRMTECQLSLRTGNGGGEAVRPLCQQARAAAASALIINSLIFRLVIGPCNASDSPVRRETTGPMTDAKGGFSGQPDRKLP